MWFNNLIVYKIGKKLDLFDLPNRLIKFKVKPCAKTEFDSYGFITPLGKHKNANLVHQVQNFYLVCAQKQQRVLPNSVIRDELADKIEAIETQQMRKIYRKEREQLRDDITQNLLPQAFIRKTKTYALICPDLDLIMVNSSNYNKADELLNLLREALGTLPVKLLVTKNSPTVQMTSWLKNKYINDHFSLLDQCELQATDKTASIIRCTRQDLCSDEISQHLSAGKIVTQLALNWQDKLTFVLDNKLAVKKLRFADILLEQSKQDGADDVLAEQDASISLMALTLAEFIPSLLSALGE